MTDEPALTNTGCLSDKEPLTSTQAVTDAVTSTPVLTETQVVRKRTKHAKEISEHSKELLLNVPAGEKEHDKDSAYFEDPDDAPCPGQDSLPKLILNIINPEESFDGSYSYTYHAGFETGSDSCSVVGERQLLAVEGSATTAASEEVHSEYSNDVLSSQEGNNHQSLTIKSNVVEIVEDHKRHGVTPVECIVQTGKRQLLDKTSTDENCEEVECGEKHEGGTIDDVKVNVDENRSITPSPIPECDWLLPVPVRAYYANLPEKSNTRRKKHRRKLEKLILGKNKHCENDHLTLLLYLDEVEHIDDWLRHNLEAGYHSLQTGDLSGVISLSETEDFEDPVWESPQHRWPWTYNGRLLIHLRPIDSCLLQPGDTYLCIQASLGDNLQASLGDNLQASLGDNLQASLGDNLQVSLSDNEQVSIGDNLQLSRTNNLQESLNLPDKLPETENLTIDDTDIHVDVDGHVSSHDICDVKKAGESILDKYISNTNKDITDLDEYISDSDKDNFDLDKDICDSGKAISGPDIDENICDLSKEEVNSDVENDICDPVNLSHFDLGINPDEDFADSSDENALRLCLMLYTKDIDTQIRYPLWQCDYGQLFTMDFVSNVSTKDPDDLAELLRHCLIAVETCTQRLSLKPSPLTPCASCRLRNQDSRCLHHHDAPIHGADDNANNNCEESVVRARILPAYDKYKEEPPGHHSHALTHSPHSPGQTLTYSQHSQSHSRTHAGLEMRNTCDPTAANRAVSSSPSNRRQQTHRQEARSVHERTADGRLLKAEPPLCTHTIPIPVTIEQLQPEALVSGAVLYPGCQDERGAAIVIIFCRHPAWNRDNLTSQELAKILLYYYTVPSHEVSHKGLTVIADARGTSLPVLNAFLQTLYTVEANLPGAVYISHVLADRVAQSLLFRSPVFRPQVNLRIDLVMTVETLYKFVSAEHLPPELGGYLEMNHVSWVHYRQKVERFLRHCKDVGELLMDLMRQMSDIDTLPSTTSDTTQQVDLHKQCVDQTLGCSAVTSLRQHGHSHLSSLSTHQQDLHSNDDFRISFRGAERLYNQVRETMERLTHLADERLKRLQTCSEHQLRLSEMKTQISQFVTWLETDGASILERHENIADNLKAIKLQQKDFDNAYFSAMTQLEKGSELVEEAKVLSQSASFSDVTSGVKDLSVGLKDQMKDYSGCLDNVRQRIEDTSRCYQLLDKSYEWALNAMKYAASVKADKSSSAESIDLLLLNLDVYRSQNQPVDVDTFEMMLDLARKLDNDKLYDQCKVARTRSIETEQLLDERTAKLRQAKQRLERESARHVAKATELELQDNNKNNVLHSSGATDGVELRTEMGNRSSSDAGTCTASPTSVDRLNVSDLSQTMDSSCSELRSPSDNSCSYQSSPADTSYSELRSPPGAFANKDMYISQLMSVLRRRSYAGKPSAPLYSPGVAAFKDSMRDMNVWEYEEYLFNEGLITEDMSDRIVAFLPKGLSDSTMRGSRESLRGSMENLNQILAESPPQEPKSGSLLRDMSAAIKDDYKAAGTTIAPAPSLHKHHGQTSPSSQTPTLNKHHRPHRKMLKKANSCSLPETGTSETLPSIRETRDIRSISMITGSTESLPCMPEEDLLDSSEPSDKDQTSANLEPDSPSTPNITTERKFGWSPVPVNTHLMYRNNRPSTFPTSQSMADLRVTEDQVKQRRTLSLLLHEMIQTERDYVRSLQFIVDNYIPEISQPDLPHTMRGKRSIIFGNIEKIYEFHNLHFLVELEKCQANPYTVCHAFLKHDQEFFLYALYNKNKPKSDILMAEYGTAFFKKKQMELGDRMDLHSYLLKPVQRMGKYSLLLKQIIQECAESDQEYNDLNAAFEMVKFQLRHGNDLLAMDCLKECDVNLQEQGMLLRQDEFLVWQGRRKCLRHVFLFEEMVLFSKSKRNSYGQDLYVYKNSIKTSDLGLTENLHDMKHKFEIWFRKRTAGGTFTLQAPTMDVKNSWVKEISMLLWKQAFRNRERRLSEASRMGIGRKPCMDLKPSKHNIHDRFVNISAAGQTTLPRMRNSIAVSSFDHLRNGSKRPHSLISVSSSSSGGSNQSTHSGGHLPVSGGHLPVSGGHIPVSGGHVPVSSGHGVLASTSMGALDVVHEDLTMSTGYNYTAEHGLDTQDLNTSLISTSSSMDAYTQTTLKRPIKDKHKHEESGDNINTSQLQLHIDHIRTTDV